jgi:protein-disulfide isomerase
MHAKTGTSQLAAPVTADDHMLGPDNGTATLVEYGDYECPYCGVAESAVQDLRRALPDTLRYVFRHFPLIESHPHALSAATTAEAAGLQGKFWQMHDLLFKHQRALDGGSLLVYAAQIGLDIDRFGRDIESDVVLDRIRRDMEGGIRSDVEGTPSFFINGVKYEASWDYESLLTAITRAGEDGDR